MARHKYVGNGKEVVGELLRAFGFTSVAVNHDDFAVVLFAHPLNEVKREATQSVLVEYHNRSDQALEHSFQKPLDAFAGFPVEARSDVGDDFDIFAFGSCGFLRFLACFAGFDSVSQIVTLSFEVTALLGAGDTGVSNDGFGFLLLRGTEGGGVEPELALDVPKVVEPLAALRKPNEANVA